MMENVNLRDNDRPFFSGLFSAAGRLRRLHFGLYVIIFFALAIVVGTIGAIVGGFLGAAFSVAGGMMVMLILLLFLLVLYVPMFLAVIKRYHDFGWSGWVPGVLFICHFAWSVYFQVAYVPQVLESAARLRPVHLPVWVETVSAVFTVVNLFVFLLIPLFMPGTKGFNRYGSNPKRPYAVQCAEAGYAVSATDGESPQ